MEIRECLSVYLESGYLFDDMSGRLKWFDIDELKNNWNHWVRTGEILFTPGNGRW